MWSQLFLGIIGSVLLCTIGIDTLLVDFKFSTLKHLAYDDSVTPVMDLSGMTVVKFKKDGKVAYAMEGPFTLHEEGLKRESELVVSVKLLKKSGSEYKETSLINMQNNYCKMLEDPVIKPHLVEYFQCTGLAETCPDKPGEYFVNKYWPDTTKFPPLEPNDYIMQVEYIISEQMKTGFQVFFEAIPAGLSG